MRTSTVFDPRYFYHARPTVEGTQIAHIEISEPTSLPAQWTPGVGMSNPWTLRWKGQARVQPNKDWRARQREVSGEFTATHAVRIQMGIGKNELGAVRVDPLDPNSEILSYGPDPAFGLGWRVHVVEVPLEGADNLLTRDYVVRNAIVSSNTWAYRLLCDTDTH